jgi:hypothetical protein
MRQKRCNAATVIIALFLSPIIIFIAVSLYLQTRFAVLHIARRLPSYKHVLSGLSQLALRTANGAPIFYISRMNIIGLVGMILLLLFWVKVLDPLTSVRQYRRRVVW